MSRWYVLAVLFLGAVAGCSNRAASAGELDVDASVPIEASLPRAPGVFAPSLMAIARATPGATEAIDGANLTDADTCSSCHPAVWSQWSASAHSFASFNNPIYRVNVELARRELGNRPSQHCGGCHDVSLQVDGAMLATVPSDDLRAHSGVTCRLCHGIEAVTKDGNGSYLLGREPLPSPNVDDPASVAHHRKAVSVKALGTELCVGCHRGFLSPDVDVPVHLSGIDEPTFWRSSAYTGNGLARVDKVDQKTCIDCHMGTEAAGADEASAHGGVVRSHRFAGGHSWMAGMRGDAVQLAAVRAQLVGAASIDIAGVIIPAGAGVPGGTRGTPTARGVVGDWYLPADGAPVPAGARIFLDVVVRNLLVGHRFPGGVNDVQDTWIELDVRDARGALLASSGERHAGDVDDDDTHVMRSLVVGEAGTILEEHELPRFRAVIANHTLAARDAGTVRYALDVPASLTAAQLPLQVDARLRHRSRTLRMQRATCTEAKTATGKTFLRETRGMREVLLQPCAPQPITEIAHATVWLGAGADAAQATAGVTRAPAWLRSYEHGMGLLGVVSERLDEPRVVLESALARLPADAASNRPRAMVLTLLAQIAGRQGRTADALALVERARVLLPAPQPAALEAISADALARVWRWAEAAPFARAATRRAPQNTQAWVMLARILGSLGDDRGALAAARSGLALAPRDPDLLRSQATALRALSPGTLADAALAAYDRFRAPDDTAALRIACAAASPRCARERELGHTHVLHPPTR